MYKMSNNKDLFLNNNKNQIENNQEYFTDNGPIETGYYAIKSECSHNDCIIGYLPNCNFQDSVSIKATDTKDYWYIEKHDNTNKYTIQNSGNYYLNSSHNQDKTLSTIYNFPFKWKIISENDYYFIKEYNDDPLENVNNVLLQRTNEVIVLYNNAPGILGSSWKNYAKFKLEKYTTPILANGIYTFNSLCSDTTCGNSHYLTNSTDILTSTNKNTISNGQNNSSDETKWGFYFIMEPNIYRIKHETENLYLGTNTYPSAPYLDNFNWETNHWRILKNGNSYVFEYFDIQTTTSPTMDEHQLRLVQRSAGNGGHFVIAKYPISNLRNWDNSTNNLYSSFHIELIQLLTTTPDPTPALVTTTEHLNLENEQYYTLLNHNNKYANNLKHDSEHKIILTDNIHGLITLEYDDSNDDNVYYIKINDNYLYSEENFSKTPNYEGSDWVDSSSIDFKDMNLALVKYDEESSLDDIKQNNQYKWKILNHTSFVGEFTIENVHHQKYLSYITPTNNDPLFSFLVIPEINMDDYISWKLEILYEKRKLGGILGHGFGTFFDEGPKFGFQGISQGGFHSTTSVSPNGKTTTVTNYHSQGKTTHVWKVNETTGEMYLDSTLAEGTSTVGEGYTIWKFLSIPALIIETGITAVEMDIGNVNNLYYRENNDLKVKLNDYAEKDDYYLKNNYKLKNYHIPIHDGYYYLKDNGKILDNDLSNNHTTYVDNNKLDEDHIICNTINSKTSINAVLKFERVKDDNDKNEYFFVEHADNKILGAFPKFYIKHPFTDEYLSFYEGINAEGGEEIEKESFHYLYFRPQKREWAISTDGQNNYSIWTLDQDHHVNIIRTIMLHGTGHGESCSFTGNGFIVKTETHTSNNRIEILPYEPEIQTNFPIYIKIKDKKSGVSGGSILSNNFNKNQSQDLDNNALCNSTHSEHEGVWEFEQLYSNQYYIKNINNNEYLSNGESTDDWDYLNLVSKSYDLDNPTPSWYIFGNKTDGYIIKSKEGNYLYDGDDSGNNWCTNDTGGFLLLYNYSINTQFIFDINIFYDENCLNSHNNFYIKYSHPTKKYYLKNNFNDKCNITNEINNNSVWKFYKQESGNYHIKINKKYLILNNQETEADHGTYVELKLSSLSTEEWDIFITKSNKNCEYNEYKIKTTKNGTDYYLSVNILYDTNKCNNNNSGIMAYSTDLEYTFNINITHKLDTFCFIHYTSYGSYEYKQIKLQDFEKDEKYLLIKSVLNDPNFIKNYCLKHEYSTNCYLVLDIASTFPRPISLNSFISNIHLYRGINNIFTGQLLMKQKPIAKNYIPNNNIPIDIWMNNDFQNDKYVRLKNTNENKNNFGFSDVLTQTRSVIEYNINDVNATTSP